MPVPRRRYNSAGRIRLDAPDCTRFVVQTLGPTIREQEDQKTTRLLPTLLHWNEDDRAESRWPGALVP